MIDYKLSATAKRLKRGIYKHYKGQRVIVYGVANQSETLEEVVVYRHETDDPNHFWVRPLSMFLETVTVHNQTISRFTFLAENDKEIV
ncbi:MAG: DUF1653 domain-containing protein [Candidatus Levyibacteriota bacterium]